ncbi:MAG: hypothetical protein ACXVPQ_12595 [Bacteroidia bacterium]
MTKTSTLISSSVLSTATSEPKAEEVQLTDPDSCRDDEPSVSSIMNILNYSKSLKIVKSEMVKTIEIVHT